MIRAARGRLELVAPASAVVVFALAAVGWDAGVPLLLATVAGFCAGRSRRRVLGGAGIVLLLAACVAASTSDDIVPMVMLPATMFAAGAALRSREAVAERLVAQAAELEAERDLYARLSVRYERSRIAAELHDVVAHAISVMVVQAGAGQRLAAAHPAAADETFAIIGAAARQAEADLDGLADLLAEDAGGDLLLVREIVDRAAASGLPVTLRLDGEGERIRGSAAHAASRVVQEGLTNALRYAPGAPVEVRVAARPARLEVDVANGAPSGPAAPGLGLGSGRGLVGLRARVADCGGTLEAGPDDAGGWALRARIPLGAPLSAGAVTAG